LENVDLVLIVALIVICVVSVIQIDSNTRFARIILAAGIILFAVAFIFKFMK